MKASSQEGKFKAGSIPGRLHWYHWIVVLLSLFLTYVAWRISDSQVDARAQSQFSFQVSQVLEIVQERMEKYEEALWAGSAALHAMNNEVNRRTWNTFASSLKIESRFPGINGIGVIHYLQPSDVNEYLSEVHELSPSFQIHPSHNRDEFWPITYIEPEANNQQALGLDMAHEQNRYEAAVKTRETGTAQITGPIALVQDEQSTPGFLFFVPWYETDEALANRNINQFNGLVYAPFMVNRLMEGTLSNTSRQIDFSIHDGDQQLYDELNSESQLYDESPMFVDQVELPLYGRSWKFDIQSNVLFREQNSSNQPTVILIGGLIIDSLLLALFITLTRSNRLAVKHAERVTERLRSNQVALRSAHDHLEIQNNDLLEANKELDQFAFVASHDLKAPLRGIRQLSQWIEEDFVGELDEQTTQYFNLLRSRIGRMERLLEDLLSYSRAGRKDGKIQTINLSEHVSDLFQLQSPPASMEFKFEGDIKEIKTLITPLDLIIRNLFSNAIKHHDSGVGSIVFKANHRGDDFEFSVSDDGPGIPVEHQKRVFELFHTLKPRDQVEGSGLGLAIIKKILDRYRCEYHLALNDTRGMTFYFTWPGKEKFEESLSGKS